MHFISEIRLPYNIEKRQVVQKRGKITKKNSK